jgi:hypothetical protein
VTTARASAGTRTAWPCGASSAGTCWTDWLVPGDEATEQDTFHGLDLLAKAADGGIIAQITGIILPDDTHHGIFQIPDEEPAVQAALCDALT